MNEQDYLRCFSSGSTNDEKHKAALRVALDTRKFEIELYWKRATYFWAFIAATFAAYVLAHRVPGLDQKFLKILLGCLGVVLSTAWLLANRGSKQWQENWEHHVDHLEDAVIGPLYKMTLPRSRPRKLGLISFALVGPSRHSVSKINQLISLYITILWVFLLMRALQGYELQKVWTNETMLLAVTLVFVMALFFVARTHAGAHTHVPRLRDSTIEGEAKCKYPERRPVCPARVILSTDVARARARGVFP